MTTCAACNPSLGTKSPEPEAGGDHRGRFGKCTPAKGADGGDDISIHYPMLGPRLYEFNQYK